MKIHVSASNGPGMNRRLFSPFLERKFEKDPRVVRTYRTYWGTEGVLLEVEDSAVAVLELIEKFGAIEAWKPDSPHRYNNFWELVLDNNV
jgi:hypothetical protein